MLTLAVMKTVTENIWVFSRGFFKRVEGVVIVGISVRHNRPDHLRRRFAAARFLGPRVRVTLAPVPRMSSSKVSFRLVVFKFHLKTRRRRVLVLSAGAVFGSYYELFRHQQITLIAEYKSSRTYFCQRLRWSRGERAALWYPSSRVQTRPKLWGFFGREKPQRAFLRRGSKVLGPMS